jgi:hypothetical protein
MVSVPTDTDPRVRAWRQQLEYVGLPHTMSMPVRRVASAGIGIGPTISGRESNPVPRPKPPASHMRGERPTTAERIWPGLARAR